MTIDYSSEKDEIAEVCAYAADAMGFPHGAVTAVSRFEDGNRHGVYRVSYRDATEAARDVVVRVSYSGDAFAVAQAEREAVVLASVGGVAAPRLYDFRRESTWFGTPAMCVEYVPGHRQDVQSAGPQQIEQVGEITAWVHARPVDDLGDLMRTTATIASYAEQRLHSILATLDWARDPLPEPIQARLRREADTLAASFAAARHSPAFGSAEPLSLLHGDIAPGNVLWNPGPCLIDWEYTRLGDPADELAYTFDQNALTQAQREAFWTGYQREVSSSSRLSLISERIAWWLPITLLGSTLWWVERWVRRTEADARGSSDPEVPREAAYYLEHVMRRLDRMA